MYMCMYMYVALTCTLHTHTHTRTHTHTHTYGNSPIRYYVRDELLSATKIHMQLHVPSAHSILYLCILYVQVHIQCVYIMHKCSIR